MTQSGTADLPLHNGYVPLWLAERMAKLGFAIIEAFSIRIWQDRSFAKAERSILVSKHLHRYGHGLAVVRHTTSVIGALKQSVNLRSKELGIYICGGKDKQSMPPPTELLNVG